MTESNIKIVKLDPTGTFIQKDEPKTEEPSIKSVYTEESSSSEEEELDPKDDLSIEETDNIQKEEPEVINHLGGAEDSSHKSQESEDYQNNEIENDLNDKPTEKSEIQTGGSNNNNNNNNEENDDEETEVFDLSNEKAYDILRGVLEDDNNNNVADNLAMIHEKMTKQNEMLENFVKDFTYSFNEKIRPLQELNETLQNQNKIFERLTTAIEKYVEASFESDDESEEEEEPLAEKNVEKIIKHVKPIEEKISVKKFSQRIPTPKVLKH